MEDISQPLETRTLNLPSSIWGDLYYQKEAAISRLLEYLKNKYKISVDEMKVVHYKNEYWISNKKNHHLGKISVNTHNNILMYFPKPAVFPPTEQEVVFFNIL